MDDLGQSLTSLRFNFLTFFFFWPHRIAYGASLVSQMVKSLPVMQETWVQSLGQEDPLEKEMATHSRFLPGKSHEWRSLAGLVGYSPWGRKESDPTKQLTLSLSQHTGS